MNHNHRWLAISHRQPSMVPSEKVSLYIYIYICETILQHWCGAGKGETFLWNNYYWKYRDAVVEIDVCTFHHRLCPKQGSWWLYSIEYWGAFAYPYPGILSLAQTFTNHIANFPRPGSLVVRTNNGLTHRVMDNLIDILHKKHSNAFSPENFHSVSVHGISLSQRGGRLLLK